MSTEKAKVAEAKDHLSTLVQRLNAAVYGQEALIEELLVCFLSRGHILMTGAPGLAKTTLVRAFSQELSLEFKRIQFTPDLLPSDIIGSEVLHIDPSTQKRSFEFLRGPIFTNILLADEINRASPRTQSAMLEAMQERQVTSGGVLMPIPTPFMVLATQNPFESEGTFPLPEAELDRFLLHSLVDYPDAEAEKKIILAHRDGKLIKFEGTPDEKPVLSASGIAEIQAVSEHIEIPEPLCDVINFLVRATRPKNQECHPSLAPKIAYGAGPRASLALISVSKALALLNGQDIVRWHMIKRMAGPVLRHRLKLSIQARREGLTEGQLISQILEHAESEFKLI